MTPSSRHARSRQDGPAQSQDPWLQISRNQRRLCGRFRKARQKAYGRALPGPSAEARLAEHRLQLNRQPRLRRDPHPGVVLPGLPRRNRRGENRSATWGRPCWESLLPRVGRPVSGRCWPPSSCRPPPTLAPACPGRVQRSSLISASPSAAGHRTCRTRASVPRIVNPVSRRPNHLCCQGGPNDARISAGNASVPCLSV